MTIPCQAPGSIPTVSRVLRALAMLLVALATAVPGTGAAPAGPVLRLNEFLASNVTIAPDNVDFDDYSDWVEIHNAGGTEVDLDGYYLTDDLASPTRWPFPAGTRIAAGGYLVVRADGFNAGPGETFRREFSPWSSFVTRRHHAPFRLSAEGEALGLFRFEGRIDPVTLVPAGSVWRYNDLGLDPGPGWTEAGFNDASWAEGPAPLGYGDGDEATVISHGPSSVSKHPAAYFRRRFDVADPGSLQQVDLRLLADDGAVVHLNGVEVGRVRMPPGPVNHLTFASNTSIEGVFDTLAIDPEWLRPGVNVLAVEVHQRTAGSSDLTFELELVARRLEGTVAVVDSVTFGQQYPDISMGRDPDTGEWVFFGEPTPGAANRTSAVTELRPSDPVSFVPPGGFREGTWSVTLSAPSPGAVIRYTRDGSVPTGDSPAYGEPLEIGATTVLRARTFVPGRAPGPVGTHTYFVDEPVRPLPVVSVAVEPALFFGTDIAIYDNVHKGREAPVHLEFHEPAGGGGFGVNAGVKIAGENIWRFPQKPLTVTLRGRYGDDVVAHPVYPGRKVGRFSEFVLRNGGDDWPQLMLRDAMTPSIVRGQMDNDVQDYRPVAGYINGAYWGIYNLREKLDALYFANRHRLPSDGYDYLEYAHTIGNVVSLVVQTGDADAYRDLLALVRTNNLSDPAQYARVEARVDVASYADYVAVEDFVNNTSWRHNREFWRAREPGARWRWVIPDLDRGFNLNNLSSSLIDNMKADDPLFAAMTANSGFRQFLAQRYAVHLSTTFHPDRIASILARLDAEVDPEIDRHIARWGTRGGFASRSVREGEMQEIRQFAAGRANGVLAGIANHLGISGTSMLGLEIDPPAGGRLRLHGVPFLPEYTNAVRVFPGLPLELEAEPAPGFRFAGWSDGSTAGPRRTLVGRSDFQLRAGFVPTGEQVLPLVIAADTTLGPAGAVYLAKGTVEVPPGVTLTIGEGVTVRLPPAADLRVHGALRVAGTAAAPVRFEALTPGRPWGAIAIVDATGPSVLSHVVVRDASLGNDPVNEVAAVSNLRSDVRIDHANIETPFPVFARGGSTTLLDSRIHIQFTGDGINVKQGAGRVERCTFTGAASPDTDAIDFDGVVDGVIRDNRIHSFRGPNSDGIDVGEGCVNLLVEGNVIFNNSDKGVSVGQGSHVILRHNLIVGCALGVGIKDTGSLAVIDGNTFARNDTAVAVYEKNLLDGGGSAQIANSIFSRSRDVPVDVDALSVAVVRYSMSDTLPLSGEANLLADPLFTDAAGYDFSLRPGSPAIDAGDPAHAPDPDGSRVDLGAGYVFDPADYPFLPPGVIVINEVLARGGGTDGDWIELHNAGAVPVDIGGWYLSDSGPDPYKYRIADGTVLPGGGYRVFREAETFGAPGRDPGCLTPFALGADGDTVRLLGPGGGLVPDYLETEEFGASRPDESLGRHYKASTRTYNFVALSAPTPGAANAAPRVGPVVISEVMYHPPGDGAAEYVELVNLAGSPVTLFDPASGEPWRFTGGIEFLFPIDPPLTLPPGGRVLLVRDRTAFGQAYAVPQGTTILEWEGGGLSNSGETLELSEPGGPGSDGIRRFVRVDRVNYSDSFPWPVAADGAGSALVRRLETAYGNDVANWRAAPPSPAWSTGPAGFADWVAVQSLPAGLDGPDDDPDGDDLPNLVEYALGTLPLVAGPGPAPRVSPFGDRVELEVPLALGLEDLEIGVLGSVGLTADGWTPVDGAVRVPRAGGQMLRLGVTSDAGQGFFRLTFRRR